MMITLKDVLDLTIQFDKVVNKYKSLQQKPIDIGTGDIIYHPEILLIKMIKNHPEKNMSELADILSLTKGAISQTSKKLVDKGYLRKFRFDDNKKEIFLKLTKKGETFYNTYMDNIKDSFQILIDFFNKNKNSYSIIKEFYDLFDTIE
jgi:DNA-binding MarR family transcriptional regulator